MGQGKNKRTARNRTSDKKKGSAPYFVFCTCGNRRPTSVSILLQGSQLGRNTCEKSVLVRAETKKSLFSAEDHRHETKWIRILT